MSVTNQVKYPKMKAFEVWCNDVNGNRVSLGFFEDPEVAHKYLEAFLNGSGPDYSWEYGVKPVMIQLRKG